MSHKNQNMTPPRALSHYGWTCSLTQILMMSLFAPFLGQRRKILYVPQTLQSWFRPPPISTGKHVETLGGWSAASGCSLSLKHRLSTRYPVVLQGKPLQRHKNKKHQSITVCLTCTFLSPFSLPHHFTTPSLFSHTPPPLLAPVCLFSLLFWAVGLLFMASPVEDALLYKTQEPSNRPAPFEDVAHNSYLGL